MVADPFWLSAEDLLAIHEDQLRRFGGASGLKSVALLESAAAAPLNLFHYGVETDLLQLAAHLAHAVVKNHAFVDGNKRTAAVALLEFLYLNGLTVSLSDSEDEQPLAEWIEKLAASSLSATQFAEQLRPHVIAG